MAVDPNWARWAFASVATVMKQLAQQADIPALVEGLGRTDDRVHGGPARVEIRMSGPFTRGTEHRLPRVSVDINLLFTSRYEINANQYDIIQIVGQFHAALDGPIPMTQARRPAGR